MSQFFRQFVTLVSLKDPSGKGRRCLQTSHFPPSVGGGLKVLKPNYVNATAAAAAGVDRAFVARGVSNGNARPRF